MHRQDHAVAVALGFQDAGERAGFGVIAFGQHRGGLAHPLDRVVQRALRQGVGHEIVGAQLQHLVQDRRADLVGDQQHLDLLGLGRLDHVVHLGQFAFVLAVDGDGDELHARTVGLFQKDQRILKVQVAPGFAQFLFHVVDQQVKTLDIPRDGAGKDRSRVALYAGFACHVASSPFGTGAPNH